MSDREVHTAMLIIYNEQNFAQLKSSTWELYQKPIGTLSYSEFAYMAMDSLLQIVLDNKYIFTYEQSEGRILLDSEKDGQQAAVNFIYHSIRNDIYPEPFREQEVVVNVVRERTMWDKICRRARGKVVETHRYRSELPNLDNI